MTRDEALKKIKKCLALSRSPEPHEAAAGMRQAQKLMAEFQISDRDLSLADVQEERVKAASAGLTEWEVLLLNMVADAFGCEHYTTVQAKYSDAGNWGRQRYMVFIGLDGSATVAGYAYEVLSRQCAKARTAHVAKQPRNCKQATKTARGDLFAKGWVWAVQQLVEGFACPAKNEALLLTYMEEKHPDMQQAKVRKNARQRHQSDGHIAAGHRAGQHAELNRAVAGRAPQGLLA